MIKTLLSSVSASLLLLAPSGAQDKIDPAFAEAMGKLLKEVRAVQQEHGRGEALIGKLDVQVTKLEALKPEGEKGGTFEVYRGAIGELYLLNGQYAEAEKALKASRAAADFDFGSWRKIIRAVYKGRGAEAAQAEYEALLKKAEGRASKTDLVDIRDMVGGELQRLKGGE